MAISRNKLIFIIIAVLVFFGMLALYILYNPSETALFPKCPLFATTGIYCPGCGSQRAAYQTLNGNILEGNKKFIYWDKFFSSFLKK